MITINGIDYLVGPVALLTRHQIKELVDAEAYFYTRTVYHQPVILVKKDATGNHIHYYLRHQPVDRQWPRYHELRTQEQLLRGWT